MDKYLDKKILFFGGKGGVGKTTMASAFAFGAAQRGKKTLLVSTDPAHNTGDIFKTAIGAKEKRLADRLWALEIDPHQENHRYIKAVKQNLLDVVQPKMMNEINKQLDLAAHTPGSDEAALFDRIVNIICHEIDAYDLVVFDTAPTGHTLRLLSLPEMMSVWIDSLLQRRQKVNDLHKMWLTDDEEPQEDKIYQILSERKRRFKTARDILLDPQKASFIFVLIPEKLPIMETTRAIGVMEDYGLSCEMVVVNRVLPEAADGWFFQRRKVQEEDYLKEIEQRLGGKARLYIPMMANDIVGETQLNEITGHLFRG